MTPGLLQLYTTLLNAQAQDGLPPAPGFSEVLSKMLPMFVIVFFIFYFMVLKPQTTKLRQQQSLLASLKKGEWVVTSSGIIGKIAGIEEDCVILEISNNVRVKVEKDYIVRRKESNKAQDKAAA